MLIVFNTNVILDKAEKSYMIDRCMALCDEWLFQL